MSPLRKKLIVRTYANGTYGNGKSGAREFENEANEMLLEGYEVVQLATNSKQIIVLYRWTEQTYTVAEATLGFDELDVG